MLQGNVKITAHIGMARHRLKHVIGKISRIGIVKPQHLHTGNHRKSVNKLGKKRAPFGNVAAVTRQVLSYDIELAGAARGKVGHFGGYFVNRTRMVPARDERYGTKRAKRLQPSLKPIFIAYPPYIDTLP